jgi:hypothetical protein
MIITGKNGCLCVFWNNLLLAGFPLSKRNPYEKYKESANDLIIDALRKGRNIKDIISQFKMICDKTYIRKKEKKKISSFDLQVVMHCILSLVRLEILDEEDVVFLAPRRKKSISRR